MGEPGRTIGFSTNCNVKVVLNMLILELQSTLTSAMIYSSGSKTNAIIVTILIKLKINFLFICNK